MMNAIIKSKHPLLRSLGTAAALIGALGTLPSHSAIAATSDPVGYMTINVAPGAPGDREYTVASFPLTDAIKFAGSVTAASGATLTVDNANWGTNEFGEVGTSPNNYTTHVLVPHSGTDEGIYYEIVSNTDEVVTVKLPTGVTDLSVTIEPGDPIRIVPVNTIGKIFGSTATALDTLGWAKNNSLESADVVYLWSGTVWKAYWFVTSGGGRWINADSSIQNRANVPVLPDKAVWIGRVSSAPMKLVVDGSVPMNSIARTQVLGTLTTNKRKFTFVSNPYPKEITLSDFGFQSLPNWSKSNTLGQADVVYIYTGSVWKAFWRVANDSRWINADSSITSRDSWPIPAGSGVWVGRISSTPTGEEINSFVEVDRNY